MTRRTLFSLALAVALTGCGSSGGGGSDPVAGAPADTQVRATRLAPNQAVEGDLTAANLRLIDVDPETADGSRFQAYEVVLTAPGTLTVLMQSSDVDSYLQLFDASFLEDPSDDSAFIAASDDTGTTLHALLSEDLDAGTYVVLAGSAFDNSADTGSFALLTLVTR